MTMWRISHSGKRVVFTLSPPRGPSRCGGERRRSLLAEEELPEDEGAGGAAAAQPRRRGGREIRSENSARIYLFIYIYIYILF